MRNLNGRTTNIIEAATAVTRAQKELKDRAAWRDKYKKTYDAAQIKVDESEVLLEGALRRLDDATAS